jgi:hypothetical protein
VTCTRDGNSVFANAPADIAPLDATKKNAIAIACRQRRRIGVPLENMFIVFLASIEANEAGAACIGLDRQRRRFVARTAQMHCDRVHKFADMVARSRRFHAGESRRRRGGGHELCEPNSLRSQSSIMRLS